MIAAMRGTVIPLLFAVALAPLTACGPRWDPEHPPGVSHGRAGAGNTCTAGEPGCSSNPTGGAPAVDATPVDATLAGALQPGDPVLPVDGTLYDAHPVQAVVGATIVVTMTSGDFDPYLHLLGPANQQLMHGGSTPGADGRTAEIIVVAPETGDYRVLANALEPGMAGAYELRIVVHPPPRPVP